MDKPRGVAQIERHIVIENLFIYFPVLLHYECIVLAADQEYILNPFLHQKLKGGFPENTLPGLVHHHGFKQMKMPVPDPCVGGPGTGRYQGLNKALCEHGFGNLDKATDIGAIDIVDVTVFLCPVFDTGCVDISHNAVKPGVNLFP